jgi:hypothetical protein
MTVNIPTTKLKQTHAKNKHTHYQKTQSFSKEYPNILPFYDFESEKENPI